MRPPPPLPPTTPRTVPLSRAIVLACAAALFAVALTSLGWWLSTRSREGPTAQTHGKKLAGEKELQGLIGLNADRLRERLGPPREIIGAPDNGQWYYDDVMADGGSALVSVMDGRVHSASAYRKPR